MISCLLSHLLSISLPNPFIPPSPAPVPQPPPPASTAELNFWKCENCSFNEKYVLLKLQEKTNITDPYALATIMGNIKQESKFLPNICEGGSRVSYFNCYRGGYGIIQWTSKNRYYGLGSFCRKYGCDPSSLEGQTSYMINESIFQKQLFHFEKNGKTIPQYMGPSYKWLGWGIKGKREIYSYDYLNKLKKE